MFLLMFGPWSLGARLQSAAKTTQSDIGLWIDSIQVTKIGLFVAVNVCFYRT